MQSSAMKKVLMVFVGLLVITTAAVLLWSPLTSSSRLIEAVEQRDVNLVRQLIDQGYALDSVSRDSYTALSVAVAYGESEIARMLIDAGADVNAPRQGVGWTPLQIAVAHRPEMIEMILEANVDPNSPKNKLALYSAISAGHTDRVRQLLDGGITSAENDHYTYTAREVAEQRGYDDIIKLLDEK